MRINERKSRRKNLKMKGKMRRIKRQDWEEKGLDEGMGGGGEQKGKTGEREKIEKKSWTAH